MSGPNRFLVTAALLLALAFPVAAGAQIQHTWAFEVLDDMGNPVASTWVVDLGVFVDGSLPAVQTVEVNGRVLNTTDPAGATLMDNLSIASASYGSSALPPELDGSLYFTQNLMFLLDQVGPGQFENIMLGSFDAAAFLAALPADGTQYAATLDLEVGANAVDEDGFDTGQAFDPSWPTIVPGPPSVIFLAQVKPKGGGPIVPEPGTLALLGALAVVGARYVVRRKA